MCSLDWNIDVNDTVAMKRKILTWKCKYSNEKKVHNEQPLKTLLNIGPLFCCEIIYLLYPCVKSWWCHFSPCRLPIYTILLVVFVPTTFFSVVCFIFTRGAIFMLINYACKYSIVAVLKSYTCFQISKLFLF